jgi:hypothetical protein
MARTKQTRRKNQSPPVPVGTEPHHNDNEDDSKLLTVREVPSGISFDRIGIPYSARTVVADIANKMLPEFKHTLEKNIEDHERTRRIKGLKHLIGLRMKDIICRNRIKEIKKKAEAYISDDPEQHKIDYQHYLWTISVSVTNITFYCTCSNCKSAWEKEDV